MTPIASGSASLFGPLLDGRENLSKEPDQKETLISRVDNVLNLGSGGSVLGSLADLSREEIAETFRVLADLYDRGIVGYETREINGEPQKVFIDVAIGSDAHRAPLVREDRVDRYV
jgi:hypothetical protein